MSANFSPTPSSIRRRILSDDTEVFDVRYRNDHGRQQSRTFSTYETAHGFQIELMTIPVQEAEARLDGVLDRTDKLTLAEYLATDVETRTGISEGTRARYRTYINGSILPSFGDRLLAEVGTLEVKRWIAQQLAAGNAGKTIKNRHGYLSSAFKNAVSDGLLSTNPCKGLKLPVTPKKEMTFLTPEEYRTLLRFIPSEWLLFVRTLAETGMRFSEVTALHGGDLDEYRNLLSVTKAWKRNGVKKPDVLGTPKTRTSRRTVSIPHALVKELMPYASVAGPHGLLFKTPEGGRITNAEFYRRVWAPARLLANGLTGAGTQQLIDALGGDASPAATPLGKYPRVHDLRHSHVSWLLAQGVGYDVIQARMGHKSITTTVDVYGHIDPKRQQAATDAITRALTQD